MFEFVMPPSTRQRRRETQKGSEAPVGAEAKSPPKKRPRKSTPQKSPIAKLWKSRLRSRKKIQSPSERRAETEDTAVQQEDARTEAAHAEASSSPLKPGVSIEQETGDDACAVLGETVPLREEKSNDVLLVYPFKADDQVLELCSDGLFDGIDHTLNMPPSSSSSTGRRKVKSVSIEKDHLKRLEPKVYLNDINIDFWIEW